MARWFWRCLTIFLTIAVIPFVILTALGLVIEGTDTELDRGVRPGQRELTGWRRLAVIPFGCLSLVLEIVVAKIINPCFARSGWDKYRS